jgi:ribosomal-protein-alanine N-acetyltransferase
MEFVKLEPSMFKELFSWRDDPFAKKYNPFADCTFIEFTKIMNNYSQDLKEVYSGKDFKWAIIDNKEILALLGISQVNKMMKTAEIGYQVSPKYRRKGIGLIAVDELVKLVFTETDLRKLVATIADANIPSCKIVEKLGFKQEGLLRKHFIINGIETDERIYGLLREEFKYTNFI